MCVLDLRGLLGSEPAAWCTGCSGSGLRAGQGGCTERAIPSRANLPFLRKAPCGILALVCDGMPGEVRRLGEAVAS